MTAVDLTSLDPRNATAFIRPAYPEINASFGRLVNSVDLNRDEIDASQSSTHNGAVCLICSVESILATLTDEQGLFYFVLINLLFRSALWANGRTHIHILYSSAAIAYGSTIVIWQARLFVLGMVLYWHNSAAMYGNAQLSLLALPQNGPHSGGLTRALRGALSGLVQYRSRTDAIYRHRHTTCYNHQAVKCAANHPTEDDLELYSLTRIPAGPVLDRIEEHLSRCDFCRSTVDFNIQFIRIVAFGKQGEGSKF